ncbi:MAG: hypothetical protein HKN49_03985 [Gammaproteobacteria bacterium]|nr:hypothetical protein [Gammaproteobacteria bacterium]
MVLFAVDCSAAHRSQQLLHGCQVFDPGEVFGDQIAPAQWDELRKNRQLQLARANALQEKNVSRLEVPGVPPGVVSGLQAQMQADLSVTGAVGTGQYNPNLLQLFQEIKGKVQKCPITFNTREDIGRSLKKGHSGGESMVQGMVGKHAFAITGIFEENVMRKRKFIQACNPWGSYGRGYSESAGGGPKLTAKEIKSGQFWLELGDFASLVSGISFGNELQLT